MLVNKPFDITMGNSTSSWKKLITDFLKELSLVIYFLACTSLTCRGPFLKSLDTLMFGRESNMNETERVLTEDLDAILSKLQHNIVFECPRTAYLGSINDFFFTE